MFLMSERESETGEGDEMEDWADSQRGQDSQYDHNDGHRFRTRHGMS